VFFWVGGVEVAKVVELEVEVEEEKNLEAKKLTLSISSNAPAQTDLHVQHRQREQPAYGRGGELEKREISRETKKSGD
jgi:hypothetical protein